MHLQTSQVVLSFCLIVPASLSPFIERMVADPLQDYVANPVSLAEAPSQENRVITTVLKIEADFEGSGKPYMLLSDPDFLDDTGRNIWSVYQPIDTGYALLVEGLLMDRDWIRVAHYGASAGDAILTYNRLNSKSGMIVADKVKPNGNTEYLGIVRKINFEDPEDRRYLGEFFGDSRAVVKSIDVSNLPTAQVSVKDSDSRPEGAGPNGTSNVDNPIPTVSRKSQSVPDSSRVRPPPSLGPEVSVREPLQVSTPPDNLSGASAARKEFTSVMIALGIFLAASLLVILLYKRQDRRKE